MSEEKLIKLEQLLSNGIVHEGYKDLNTSIFSVLYSRGKNLLRKIIEDNSDWKQYGKNQKNTDFERSNIISFVGKRGTGKTSAMLSFKDMLDLHTSTQNYGIEQIELFSEDPNFKNTKFYTLDCIDASIMEESENVFILVLANMFAKIQHHAQGEAQKIREYDNRMLFQKFEKIYEDYVSLNSSETVSEGYSAFEKMRNAGSSQKIRENFEELVKLYLGTIDSNSRDLMKTEQRFLVITLDDIDIARRKKGDGKENWGTYKIMSTIYKYLTVPGVIVLTAYDYSNLQERCLSFFENENGNKGGFEEATLQFIEKVFPIYSRLYMPALEDEIKIDIGSNRWNMLHDFRTRTNRHIFSLKEFIFAMMYDKTEVCFDYDEMHKHFIEPDTLRSLYNMTELLHKLDEYDHLLESKADLKKFQENIEWVEEDCNFRYKEEILVKNKKESDLLNLWMQEPIDRRGESIVKAICSDILPLGLDIRRLREEEMEESKRGIKTESVQDGIKYDNSHVAYSYAELVHSIFHMTRDKQKFSKKFIFCLLYSYTLHLTEIYKVYQWSKRQINKTDFMAIYRDKVQLSDPGEELHGRMAEIEKSYHILLAVTGRTICGKWAQYFFPDVTASALFGNNNYTDIRVRGVLLGYIEHQPNEFPLEFSPDDTEEQILIKVKAFIFVSMLNVTALDINYENVGSVKADSTNIRWELRENNCTLRLVQGSKDDYELTAFLKHVFSYTEYFCKYEDLIRNPLKTCGKPYAADLDRKIGKAFDQLWNDYYEWDRAYGNAIIPFYNLDITYNMIKKNFLDYSSEIPTLHIQMNDENTLFFLEYKRMLDKFKNYLKKIDQVYQLEGKSSFGEIMSECPFYKMIDELQADSSSRIAVSNYICSIVMRKMEDRGLFEEIPVG